MSSAWKCENCTLENLADAVVCEVCDKPRPPPQNGKSKWICSECTFENEPTSLHCQMCGADTTVQEKREQLHKEFVWEWKGGSRWHEYPQRLSDQIEDAYFNGQLTINLDLPHAQYVIDLTKLQQINTTSNKARKIQRVQYEFQRTDEDKEAEDEHDQPQDHGADAGNNRNRNRNVNGHDEKQQMDVDDQSKAEVATDEKSAPKDVWICAHCTLENETKYKQCQVCEAPRQETKVLPSSPSKNTDNLMGLSSADDDEDVAMKNTHNKPLKRGKAKNKGKQPQKKKEATTLLSIFQKDEKIPSPLHNLKKKKKRKLEDILNEDQDATTTPLKKKQKLNDEQVKEEEAEKSNSVKISTKYAGKHTADASIGSTLNKALIDALWELSMIEVS